MTQKKIIVIVFFLVYCVVTTMGQVCHEGIIT